MPNLRLINKHNKTVLDPPTNNSERTCNCINSEKCPLPQKCLTNNMYNATKTSNQENTITKYIMALPKPNSNSHIQTT